MRPGIRQRTVSPGFAASFDLDDRVCVHIPDPPRSVGVAGTGGINGKLIADKLDRRGAERGTVRRESPARAAYLSWKAAGTARSGPPPPPRVGHNRQTGAELTLERLSG